MPSTFTWLDTSEHDRQRALDVIDLFRSPGTVDELGVGTIRDAVADLLFPGTSTIQTRARYFLFIPWMYRRLEELRVAGAQITRRAHDEELRLIDALATAKDSAGTIGIDARRDLKRLPTAIYWGGLGIWGIRLFRGSRDLYHRSFDRLLAQRLAADRAREDREAVHGVDATWHPHVPPAPDGFPTKATFTLRRADALYLQDRILTHAPGTLLAYLVESGVSWADTAFPWGHPTVAELPDRLAAQLAHARCFSEVLHGSALLYNRMLAESAKNDELIERYGSRLARWGQLCADRVTAHRSWDRRRFWDLVLPQNPRIPVTTRSFVDAWCDLALANDPGALVEDRGARRLIQEREAGLKGTRARLGSPSQLNQWRGDSGVEQLSFRWNTTQTILIDILHDLAAETDDARAA